MTPETLLQEVSRFAAGVRDGNVGPEILQDARRRTIDIIGIALAASGMEPARIVGGVIEGWGGEEQAGVIGRGERYPAASAALMNGTLAHSLDYDDTHLPSVLHPSAAVVPAALAAAESSGAKGRDLLAAIAAGNELVVRVGMAGYDPALGNSIFFEKGLHATSIAGTLGAALAAAMVYGLGEEETRSRRSDLGEHGRGHHRSEPYRRDGQTHTLRLGRALRHYRRRARRPRPDRTSDGLRRPVRLSAGISRR